MSRTSSFATLLLFLILAAGTAVAYTLNGPTLLANAPVLAGALASAVTVSVSVKHAAPLDEWDKAVVLQWGRLRALQDLQEVRDSRWTVSHEKRHTS